MTGLDMAEQFTVSVRKAQSYDDIHTLLSDVVPEIGFYYFALIPHTDLRRRPPEIFQIENYPRIWVDHFIRNLLYLDDPVLLASARTTVGFPWSELPRLINLTPKQRSILERGTREGLGAGFTVPAHVPGERMGSCSFATLRGRALPEANLLIAQLIGSFAFEAARRIANNGLRPFHATPRLRPRERQCLILAGQGKSAAIVGELLGLSQSTVANYLSAAQERYGVASRIQLLSRALYDGEIGFSDLRARN